MKKDRVVINKRFLSVLSSPLPIVPRPFRLWADRLNINEDSLLETIKAYLKHGVIRRFGAVLDHRKIGLDYNVLVAWNVKEKIINSVTEFMCSFPQVSHCYKRKTDGRWLYNLYTMIHCSSKNDCMETVKKIARRTKIKNYRLLFTQKEFKKTRFLTYARLF